MKIHVNSLRKIIKEEIEMIKFEALLSEYIACNNDVIEEDFGKWVKRGVAAAGMVGALAGGPKTAHAATDAHDNRPAASMRADSQKDVKYEYMKSAHELDSKISKMLANAMEQRNRRSDALAKARTHLLDILNELYASDVITIQQVKDISKKLKSDVLDGGIDISHAIVDQTNLEKSHTSPEQKIKKFNQLVNDSTLWTTD